MPEFRIPYGRTQLSLRLGDSFQTELLAPAPVPPVADPVQAVRDALRNPLGGVRLANFAGARSAAIAVNDKTRPVPHAVLLPPLLQELANLGLPPGAITFVIATGLHAPMKEAEFAEVLPADIVGRYRVVSHDAAARDLVAFGLTRRGTPVHTNRIFAQADLRLVVGNLEPHQFMGFSGGVKTAAIGLAGTDTINANHALMLDPRSDLARYDDNPARQEVEEIGRLIGVHFALNDVLNENKQIVRVLAGEPQAVVRAGIPSVLELYRVRVAAPFEVMVVSPGGHPKDINLYQAQKALGHAARVSRKGGTIILVAACPEGTGSRSYEDWVAGMASHEAVIERFKREGFRIGPHKAFQIARDASPRRVLLMSQMPSEFVRKLLLTPYASLESALALALKGLPPSARIGIMPWANATIPEAEN
ncbi:MAG: nickel-dependent lactate racemase [Verrucomicrobiota bacterium]|jgi:nickel-dependent lactate racemase